MDEAQERALGLVAEGKALLRAQACSAETCDFGSPGGRAGLAAAEAMYTEALSVWPECSAAFAARVSARYLLGDHEGARADARTAVRLNHPDPEDYLELSFPFSGEEQRSILQRGIGEAERGSSTLFFLRHWLARSYSDEGDFAAQVRELEQLVADMSAVTTPHLRSMADMSGCELAGALERVGDRERAISIYRSLLRRGERQPLEGREGRCLGMGARGLVRALVHAGRNDEALSLVMDGATPLDDDDRRCFRALLFALEGGAAPLGHDELLSMGDGRSGGYARFCAGAALVRAGQVEDGGRLLLRFVRGCEANPSEWGVTLRWEIALARRLLREAGCDELAVVPLPPGIGQCSFCLGHGRGVRLVAGAHGAICRSCVEAIGGVLAELEPHPGGSTQPESAPSCSFCERGADEVEHLIASRYAGICGDCVLEILATAHEPLR